MDGVYTISIFAKDGSVVTVDFEQYKEGVFTWNNLDNGAGTGVMSRYDWNGAHNGGAVVSSANATDTTLPIISTILTANAKNLLNFVTRLVFM